MSSDLPNLFALDLEAFIVDLDGVVTRTAGVHARAWKQLFDDYLKQRADKENAPFVAFDIESDYTGYVDGKPRYDGVRSFLLSRGIDLPWGATDDPPDAETVCGLGNRKNALFVDVMHTDGAEVFDTSVELIRAMKDRGIHTAVVSSSKNCQLVLETAGLMDLFEVMIDGIYAETNGIPGKPNPDTFLRGAQLLGVDPAKSALVEDAIVGVQAGRAGGFKLVIGVDRGAGRQALLDGGADVVVSDLGEFDLGA